MENLKELVKYHPYHISTFADFANVTVELFEAALNGEEELTTTELRRIARYTGIPFSVLTCPKLITLTRDRRRHWMMMKELQTKLYAIWEYQKQGSKEADFYMKYLRVKYVNMDLDFRNRRTVSYCRYLGVKHEMNDILSFCRYEFAPKPRRRKEVYIDMTKKSAVIIEFMEELRRSSLDNLEKAKVVLLAVEYGNEKMTDFLRKAFEIEERRRPKLLEMKK